MSSIQTGIELQDNFTNVMYSIIDAMSEAVYAADDLQSEMNESVNTSAYDQMQADIQQTANELNEASQNQNNFNQEIRAGTQQANKAAITRFLSDLFIFSSFLQCFKLLCSRDLRLALRI